MSTVRTVTTVQTSGMPTDSNLDALLEDLQTSVGRNHHTSNMNGGAPGGGTTKVYREVTRTVKHGNKPGYQQQVEYLVPANTTTVVAERAPSPGVDLITQVAHNAGVTAYKTTTVEYNTTKKTAKVLPEANYEYRSTNKTTTLPETTSYEYSTSKKSASMLPEGTSYEYSTHKASSLVPERQRAVEDAGLRKNLTELDSLLVDLHHAQKAGFGDQGGRGRSRSNDAVPLTRGGIDLGLLEPLDSSTPAPPSRSGGGGGGQHVSRSTVQEQRTYHTYNAGGDGGSPQRYHSSDRQQPKRASSVNRELIFNESNSSTPVDHVPHQRVITRSPSPHRRGGGGGSDLDSPQVPRRKQQQVIYEKTTTTSSTGGGGGRQPRSTTTSHSSERYRDKSPSNQRLHREVYGAGDSRNNSVPASPRHDRYQEMSPPSQRRNHSPSPVRSHPSDYPTKSSTLQQRTYNYTTSSNTTHTSPRPYRSPSPISNRSPYVENAPIIELPRRSPSPQITYQNNGPNQPPTKVTTTVRTYTYELPPGQTHPYPPPGSNGYTVQEPVDYPDRPANYQVTTHTHKQPEPPPTVISYKYSSHHSSHNTNTTGKYPPHGEEPQHLQPRPFPTPSPQPGPNGEPPKKLEELMASFGDTTEITQQRSGHPPGYFTSERQTASTLHESRPQVPPHETNGVAVVAPSNVKPMPPGGDGVRNRGNMKNVAGPPVYYPPGVELFAHKDQEAKMMSTKASGEYEMSKESQSKGSSGGAGVVPVCLPLCCAMPCTIL